MVDVIVLLSNTHTYIFANNTCTVYQLVVNMLCTMKTTKIVVLAFNMRHGNFVTDYITANFLKITEEKKKLLLK